MHMSFILVKLTIFTLLQLFQSDECISFDAQQKVPVGLLQPAPAVFYDYYEPSKTTIHFDIIFGMLKGIYIYNFRNFFQAYSALCSTLPPEEANLSPNCVLRTCASVQKVCYDPLNRGKRKQKK